MLLLLLTVLLLTVLLLTVPLLTVLLHTVLLHTGYWAGLSSLFWGGLRGDVGVVAGMWIGEVVGEDEKRDPGLGDSLRERLVGEKRSACSRVG